MTSPKPLFTYLLLFLDMNLARPRRSKNPRVPFADSPRHRHRNQGQGPKMDDDIVFICKSTKISYGTLLAAAKLCGQIDRDVDYFI